MNRRSFLKRLTAAVVATVSAPIIIREIIRKELPSIDADYQRVAYWIQTSRVSYCYDDAYLAAMKRILTESHAAREVAAGRTCPFYE